MISKRKYCVAIIGSFFLGAGWGCLTAVLVGVKSPRQQPRADVFIPGIPSKENVEASNMLICNQANTIFYDGSKRTWRYGNLYSDCRLADIVVITQKEDIFIDNNNVTQKLKEEVAGNPN